MSGLTKKHSRKTLWTYHVDKSWILQMLRRRFTRHKNIMQRRLLNLRESKQIRAYESHFSVGSNFFVYSIQYTHKKYSHGLVPLNGQLGISLFDKTGHR